jgi:hypothetical protein
MPKELINEVAMSAMNFDRVKSQRFGVRRRLRKRPDGFGNVVLPSSRFPRSCRERRSPMVLQTVRVATNRNPWSHHAHMPELRSHDTPNRMHFINHRLPPTK